jgi:hypothetical protein
MEWRGWFRVALISATFLLVGIPSNPIIQAAWAEVIRRRQFFLYYITPEGFGGFLKYPGFLPAPEPLQSPIECLYLLKQHVDFLDKELSWSYFDTGSTRGGYVVTTKAGERIEYPFLEFATYGTNQFLRIELLAILLTCHLEDTVHLDKATLLKVSVGYPHSPVNHGFGLEADAQGGWSAWFVNLKNNHAVPKISISGSMQLEQYWWVLPANLTSEEIHKSLNL